MNENRKPLSLGLTLGALGIVYGDIGTSPLYAVKECFHGAHAIQINPTNIMGVLSLVFWSLTIVVSIKYITFIMRADNRGEGGIFALLALVPGPDKLPPRVRGPIIFAGLTGASLLYGDGFITPAISVLSAVEGLEVATDAARNLIVPITCAILLCLFLFQSRGTEGIGKVFGPVMLVWFAAIASLGVVHIIVNPQILWAVNPLYAMRFFAANHLHGLLVLGSVVLVVTGGEALYADMGHFGKPPIRLSWFGLVFPALLLNYFGQGALLLSTPEAAVNPFYSLVPKSLLFPMVILSTAATIIASQAMISGAFSITRQAVQLGYFPRVTIVHTSPKTEGQIYIPEINWIMMIVCIALVLVFRGSSGLAGAYGVAVTADMALTSVVFFFVATTNWQWPIRKALPLAVLFLIFDLTFFGSNLLKFFDGGWFPIVVGAVIVTIMTAWKDGRAALSTKFRKTSLPFSLFLEDVVAHKTHRVPGTAVFLASSSIFTPPSLLHHFKHSQVLHQEVILLTIVGKHVPVVRGERIEVEVLGNGFYRLIAQYGFMETPNVPRIMKRAFSQGLIPQREPTSYYLGRETLLPTGDAPMMRWRKRLFAFLSRNSQTATNYFGLPPGQVVELGVQVEL